MTHKDAPPETLDQAACRAWWTDRLGPGAVGWGRDKHGNFLAEFPRRAEAAWTAARQQARKDAEAEGARAQSGYHFAWTSVIETLLEVAGDTMRANPGTNLESALATIRALAAKATPGASA